MKTQLVGILNLTPDSFSDGNRHPTPADALKHAEQMAREGASVLDVGAESTRPGATPLSAAEEWERLAPFLPQLMAKKLPCRISLDTRHPETAEKALMLGVHWINDVSGAAPPMAEALKGKKAQLVLMHSLSVPADPNRIMPPETDVIEALLAWGKKKIRELEKAGIAKERIIFDPGIGFGKSADQSLSIIRHAERLKALGVPLLFGHSRKSFLRTWNPKASEDRDLQTASISAFLAQKGVDYLRVHHIRANMAALKEPLKSAAGFE
jgi:dihydropteroate synthase